MSLIRLVAEPPIAYRDCTQITNKTTDLLFTIFRYHDFMKHGPRRLSAKAVFDKSLQFTLFQVEVRAAENAENMRVIGPIAFTAAGIMFPGSDLRDRKKEKCRKK